MICSKHRIATALVLSSAMLFTLIPAVPARAGDADKPIRALFVCGGCCHDYTHQKDIITKGISARANVEWVIAFDPDKGTKHKNPVYDNADWYKDFDVIVHDECCADVNTPDVIETVLKPHKDGLAGVVLHCAMHSYRTEGWNKGGITPWFEFTGFPSTHHRAQIPISITYVDKESPISKGFDDWTTIHEELYANAGEKLVDTAHALARGKQVSKDKEGKEHVDDDVCIWTNLYNGKAKVFGTTIGHNNETCADARYLDLVTRGLLWSVDKLDDAHLKPAAKVLIDEPASAPAPK